MISGSLKKLTALAAAPLAAIAVVAAVSGQAPVEAETPKAPAGAPAAPVPTVTLPDFRETAARVVDSVVTIRSVRERSMGGGESGFSGFFERSGIEVVEAEERR